MVFTPALRARRDDRHGFDDVFVRLCSPAEDRRLALSTCACRAVVASGCSPEDSGTDWVAENYLLAASIPCNNEDDNLDM